MSAVLGGHSRNHAGTRLFGVTGLYPFLSHDGAVGALAAAVLGQRSRPVRAVLFDKTPEANWLYATPILHASQSATAPSRRRVLQVEYAAKELPGGLEWLGI
jgi:hypothetical protein